MHRIDFLSSAHLYPPRPDGKRASVAAAISWRLLLADHIETEITQSGPEKKLHEV